MKNGKTPGIDGFPAEFFKVFWGKLKYFILRSASLIFKNGMMSCSLHHCIISCIPRGDKDRTLLKIGARYRLKKNVTNNFYYDLLTSWQHILEVITISESMNMLLWYNPHISKSNFFQKNMYVNGCIFIADVSNMDGQTLSCDILVEFFHHHCSFLDYYRLKTGLTNYLKKLRLLDQVLSRSNLS